MMDYKNLTDLNSAFIDGGFKLKEKFSVGGIPYEFLYSSTVNIYDDILKKIKPFVLFSTNNENSEKATEQGLMETLIFAWAFDNLVLQPIGVRPIKIENIKNQITLEQENRNIIGDQVEVKFVNLPNGPTLKAKVDSGASICSFHAEKWDIKDRQVQFTSSLISNNLITVPLVDQVAIKTADAGVEYRPVIALDVKINDKIYPGIKFNLNNRSNMEGKILIGQNLLEKGGFLIDPRLHIDIHEQMQYIVDNIDEIFEDVETERQDDPIAKLREQFDKVVGTLIQHQNNIGV
jgi:hypothetical protein